jgi:serine/threonine protein kinase/WD40 repeat protein/tetratricopeptide (TPR) repeat protein
MIEDHFRAGSFLECGESGAGDLGRTADQGVAERAGTVIGPYKLLQQIGEGGFGVVFMAEQTTPVRRRVALKILKPGMDTKHVVARFEAERQALAIMDHPNIARVFDGGATPSGRLYFVMELVKGVPITQFCDDEKLSPRQRLELFVSVCQAVQHAHHKGIIHRDLKPTNVLVSRHDSTPVVKVIDFGVAKALGQELTDKTLFTGIAQMVGTPLYMSPEQAGMSDLDVDTRSDIYSLGVLLYELLTGTTPFDRDRFKKAAYDEIRRIIREEEPPKPSTRLSSLSSRLAPREEPGHVTRSVAATLASIAAQRQTEPAKLTNLVRGELDWIVMKALEKDRNLRYETANGFAMDVQRYLADEAVQACPPSTGYRLRKFARRNKRALATAAFAAVMLLVAAAGALLYAAEQRRLAKEHEALAVARDRFAAEQGEALKDLETIQRRTQDDLYQALIRQSAALREGRQPGYRARVWTNLRQAAELPARNLEDIRSQVLACLGDPVGLEPMGVASVQQSARPEIPERFRAWLPKQSNNLAAVAPDGKLLASWSGRIAIRDEDGKSLASADVPLGSIYDLRFTTDGQLLVAGCEQGVAVWTVPDLQLSTFYRGHNAHSVATQPGGSLIASSGLVITVWSLRSNQPVATLKPPSASAQVEFSADGKLLLAVERGKVVAAWSVGDTPEKLDLGGHQAGVPSVAFSPDGKLLASAGSDRKVKFWDARSGALLHTGEGNSGVVESVAFSPDSALLATGGDYPVIRLWDPATGKQIGQISASTGKVWRLHFDTSGRYLAAAGDRGVGAWAIRRGNGTVTAEEFLVLPTNGPVWDVAIHPGGTGLVFNSSAGLASFELAQAHPRAIPVRPQLGLRTLHFDPAGNQIRFKSADGRFGAVGWPGAQPVRVPDLKPGGYFAGSPDGRWLAAPDSGGRAVIVYDLESGREWAALPPQAAVIWALNWSPDGASLAAGLADGGVVVWNLEQIRARLADFGIKLPSTAARTTVQRPPPLSEAAFERMFQINRLNPELLQWASLTNVVRLRPENAVDQNQLAWLLATCAAAELRDPKRAIEHAHKAIALSPEQADYWNTLGAAQYRAGNWNEAIAALQKHRELRNNDAEWTNPLFLAMTHWQLGNKDEAVQWYNRSVDWMEKKQANSELMRRLRAETAALLNIEDGTQKKAFELDPKDAAPAYHNLGLVLAKQGRLDEAIATYEKAIKLGPKVAIYYANLGIALRAQNKVNDAIASWNKAVELDPNDPKVFISLGAALGEQKKPDEAIDAYRKAIDLDPKLAPAHRNLGVLLCRHRQDYDGAMAASEEASWLQPGNAAIPFELASELALAKQWDRSASVYAKGLERFGALLWPGPWYEAIRSDKVFTRLTALRPGDRLPGIMRARLHVLQRDWKGAAAVFARLYQSLASIDQAKLLSEADDLTGYACLLLLLGDPPGYEQFCKKWADRIGHAQGWEYSMSRAWAVSPRTVVPSQQIVEWVTKTVQARRDPWCLHVLSLAHYRNGELDVAIKYANESNTGYWRGSAKSLNWLVLAMAHHHLGRNAEARTSLEQARLLAGKASPMQPPGADWPDMAPTDIVEFELLRREAEELIHPKAMQELEQGRKSNR